MNYSLTQILKHFKNLECRTVFFQFSEAGPYPDPVLEGGQTRMVHIWSIVRTVHTGCEHEQKRKIYK